MLFSILAIINLHSHQQHSRVPFIALPLEHLLFLCFLRTAAREHLVYIYLHSLIMTDPEHFFI